jgi:UTP-glucose-1-phosphate uridylyltransferase
MFDPPRHLVIPAAGLGTRMKLVYPWLPKEMLPLGAHPALYYALQEARDAQIDRIIVILNWGKQIVRRYLEQQDLHITVCYQNALSGEADAIALAESVVGNHSLAILYPDNIFLPAPGALKVLGRVYAERQSDVVALSLVTEANEFAFSNSGRVDLETIDETTFRVLRGLPKGPGFFERRFEREWRTCGMMVTGPHIFDIIHRARAELSQREFTDEPIRDLLVRERGLLGIRLPGAVFDIGNPDGYRYCIKQIDAADNG